MKNEKIIMTMLISYMLAMSALIVIGCYKEYIDIKAKVAIIKMSNK